MSCTTIRARLHDWMDQPGAPGMPAEVALHVHDCADCRSFIKRWNSIELSIQSARSDVPPMSSGFRAAIYDRLDQPRVRRPMFGRMPGWRYTLAGATAAAALAAMLYGLASMRLPSLPPHSTTNSLGQISSPTGSSQPGLNGSGAAR